MQQIIGFSERNGRPRSTWVSTPSTNGVLQRELDGVSWASFAGGIVFSVGTMPIGGGSGWRCGHQGDGHFSGCASRKKPTDLKIMNRHFLLGMGASSQDTERF